MDPTSHSPWGVTLPCPLLINQLSANTSPILLATSQDSPLAPPPPAVLGPAFLRCPQPQLSVQWSDYTRTKQDSSLARGKDVKNESLGAQKVFLHGSWHLTRCAQEKLKSMRLSLGQSTGSHLTGQSGESQQQGLVPLHMEHAGQKVRCGTEDEKAWDQTGCQGQWYSHGDQQVLARLHCCFPCYMHLLSLPARLNCQGWSAWPRVHFHPPNPIIREPVLSPFTITRKNPSWPHGHPSNNGY